jgi:hypothetical protein
VDGEPSARSTGSSAGSTRSTWRGSASRSGIARSTTRSNTA